MTRLALLSISALACLLAARCLPVEAGPATDSLRATYAEANHIISDPATVARPLELFHAVRALFGTAFDFTGAAEDALGSEWQARTAIEQKEFTSLFASFVQRGFVYWLASVAAVDGSGITVYSQIRTLATERIGNRLGRASPEELAQVLEGLNEILGA
jgi:ABC-type transporter MlaC component